MNTAAEPVHLTLDQKRMITYALTPKIRARHRQAIDPAAREEARKANLATRDEYYKLYKLLGGFLELADIIKRLDNNFIERL